MDWDETSSCLESGRYVEHVLPSSFGGLVNMGTDIGFIPTKPRSVYYDTYANLPIANVLTGDLAWATDRGVFYRWSGVAWVFVSISSRSGALGDIGVAANYPPGSLYQDTTNDELYMLIGGAWVKIVATAPSVIVSKVRKTADQTVNNSAVYVNDTHLVLPVAGNETWDILTVLKFITGGVPDLKLRFIIPAGSSITAYSMNLIANGAVWGATDFDFTGDKKINGSGATGVIGFRALYIGAGSAGNVQLQWAQNTADVSDTKVLIGSCLICHNLT